MRGLVCFGDLMLLGCGVEEMGKMGIWVYGKCMYYVDWK